MKWSYSRPTRSCSSSRVISGGGGHRDPSRRRCPHRAAPAPLQPARRCPSSLRGTRRCGGRGGRRSSVWAPCMPTAGRSRRRCWRWRCRNLPRRGSKVRRPPCAPWGLASQSLGTVGSGTKYHAPKGSISGENDALRARGAVILADRRVQRGAMGSGPKRHQEPRNEKPIRVIHGRLMVYEATAPKNRP
jgi:hypothetical protein